MLPLSRFIILATLFLKFVSGKKGDMIAGSTEHVFEIEGRNTIDPDKYRTQKIYFYFRASSLVFNIASGESAFCPPSGEWLDYYMKLQKFTKYDIELMALDDVSYEILSRHSKDFSGLRVCAIQWLIEYLKNEFFDGDRHNKMHYSFSTGAYRMRALYDDLCELHFSKEVLFYYRECIEILRKGELHITADRCGNLDIGGRMQVNWVINELFPFFPNQGLVATNTNLSHMEKILESKALFVQSPSRLSHAAIVAQEIGKPCFFGISDIFLKLWHGDEIEFFPHEKNITILKRFYEK